MAPESTSVRSNSGPTFDDLPQEIVNIIIDELALAGSTDSRKRDLQSCNLVSTSFCRPTRKHIFSDVYLDIHSGETESKHSDLLCDLVEGPPQPGGTAELVRSFTLRIRPGEQHKPFNDKKLPFILGALNSLQTFTLSNDAVRAWPALSNDIKAALWELHDHPSITSLQITDFDGELRIPVDYLSKWASLKTFRIVGHPFEQYGKKSVPMAVQNRTALVTLESLDVRRLQTPFWEIELGSISLVQKLKNLKASVIFGPDSVWVYLILVIAGHLETLDLNQFFGSFIGLHYKMLKDRYRAYHFRSLREVNINEPQLSVVFGPACLVEYLLPLATCHSIESMKIRLCYTVEYFPHDFQAQALFEEKCLDPTAWLQLDETLASAPCLRILDFEVDLRVEKADPSTSDGPDQIERRRRFQSLSQQWTTQAVFPQLSTKPNVLVHVICGATESLDFIDF